jgi:hypothetical protein
MLLISIGFVVFLVFGPEEGARCGSGGGSAAARHRDLTDGRRGHDA